MFNSMKTILLGLIFFMATPQTLTDFPLVKSATGKVVRLSVPPPDGNQILPRPIDVWLPPGYDQDTSAHYPVLYMHDGQNLFDSALSFIGVDWGVDEWMTRLINEGKIRPAIVVGIWNSPERVADYMPEKPVKTLNRSILSELFKRFTDLNKSDDYLKYLVFTLKPEIDRQFRTMPDAPNTIIMGSSMGGLISLYAMCEYPAVFGSAGCVSTHWPAADGLVLGYLKTNLPNPGHNRWYFDFGTETLDKDYEPFQVRADTIMQKAGYQPGKDWITLKFEGADHSERSWNKRLDKPLLFLLGR